MKLFIVFFFSAILLILISCSISQPDNKSEKSINVNNQITSENYSKLYIDENNSNLSSESSIHYLKEIGKSDSLFQLFEIIESDSIFIKTNESEFNQEIEWHIDYKYYKIFYDLLNHDISNVDDSDLRLYRLYPIKKIHISENIIGLVILKWGTYTFTKQELFLYDVKSQKMLYGIELSNTWGDAGVDYNEVSWLMDINKDGFYDLVTKKNLFIPIEGPGPNGVVGHITDSITVYKGFSNRFEKVFVQAYCDSANSKTGLEYNIVTRLSEDKVIYNKSSAKDFDINLTKFQEYDDF